MCVSQAKTSKEVMQFLLNEIRSITIVSDVTSRGFFPGFAVTPDVKAQLQTGIELIRQGRPIGEVAALSQEIRRILRGKKTVFFENRKMTWLEGLAHSIAELSIKFVGNDLLDPIRDKLRDFNCYCFDGAVGLEPAVARYWEIIDLLERARVEHEAREVKEQEDRHAEAAELERLAREAIQSRWEQDALELEDELAELPTV